MSYAEGVVRHASLAAFLVLVVCGACSSVPDLNFADDAGRTEGGPGTSGGPCVKTGNEICDDGIDNDCNGDIDCADDACDSRYTCVDRAPDDWQLTALVEGSRPGCPTGFGDGKDVRTVTGSTGTPACGCDCGGGAACAPAG